MKLDNSKKYILFFLVALTALTGFNNLAISENPESTFFRLQILSGNLNAWSFTTAYQVVGPLFRYFERNVVVLNTIYLLTLFLLAMIVGYCLQNTRGKNSPKFLNGGTVLALGSCGIIIYSPVFCVEYNHLALIITLIIAAWFCSAAKPRSTLSFAKVALLGILLGFLTSIKVSAGLLISLALWGWVFWRAAGRAWLGIVCQALIWWLLGVTTGAGIFSAEKVAGLGHFREFDLAMEGILSHLGVPKFGPAVLYLSRLLILNSLEISILLLLGGGFFLLAKNKNGQNIKKSICWCVMSWVLFSIVFFFLGGDSAQTPEKHNYQELGFWIGKIAWYGAYTALPAFSLVAINIDKIFKINGGSYLYLKIFLLIAPFLCAFGTAFRLIHHCIIYSWMWILASWKIGGTDDKNHRSPAWLLSAVIFIQATGACLNIFVSHWQNENYARSLIGFPSGNYFWCSKETEKWLKEIQAAAKKYSIIPGSSVFCRGEYTASFIMNWKNPPLAETPGKNRWAVVSEVPLPHRESSIKPRRPRSLGFALFGPPDDASTIQPSNNDLEQKGYRRIFRTIRPDGRFTEIWEKSVSPNSLSL